MEGPFDLPIYLDYIPPRRLFMLIVISHVGAAWCLSAAVIAVSMKYLLLIAICYSFGRYCHRYRSQRRQPLRLMLNREDEWSVLRPGDGSEVLWLRPGSFVHPRLLVIRLERTGGQGGHIIILTAENCAGDVLRRLRVRLRFPRRGERSAVREA